MEVSPRKEASQTLDKTSISSMLNHISTITTRTHSLLNNKEYLANIEQRTIYAQNGEIKREPNGYYNYSNVQYIVKFGIEKSDNLYKFMLDTGSTTLL